jgi:hypothetical protein
MSRDTLGKERMSEPSTTWTDQAEHYSKAAERAYQAGDIRAFVDIISLAAGCVQVARNLEQARQGLATLANDTLGKEDRTNGCTDG